MMMSIQDILSLKMTVLVAVLLFFVMWLIRWAKGDLKIEMFNFKKDYSDVIKKKSTLQALNGESTFIGTSYKKPVYVSNKAKHVFICGTTGSGKTVAISNFIQSGISHNYPMLIVDGKGDIGSNSMLDIVTKLKTERKVYVINLNNPETSDKYNPFKNTSSDVIKDMLINMTEWSEPHYKYNTELYAGRLCALLELAGITISFDSFTKHLPAENFILLSKKLSGEKIITREQHIENANLPH